MQECAYFNDCFNSPLINFRWLRRKMISYNSCNELHAKEKLCWQD